MGMRNVQVISFEIIKLLDEDGFVNIKYGNKKHIEDEKKKLSKSYNKWHEFNYDKSKFLRMSE